MEASGNERTHWLTTFEKPSQLEHSSCVILKIMDQSSVLLANTRTCKSLPLVVLEATAGRADVAR